MYATATKQAMKEETEELGESVIDDLRKIVKTKSAKDVKFKDGQKLKVDMTTASAMVQVHDKLKSSNAKKFADSINKNENMFMKMLDFAFSGGKKR
jgi:23S rRNA pseudoU1915 N3-methylase RlmH